MNTTQHKPKGLLATAKWLREIDKKASASQKSRTHEEILASHPSAFSAAPESDAKGWEAIEAAEQGKVTLHKYADPIEGARSNISVDKAREVAKEDPGLIYAQGKPELPWKIEKRTGGWMLISREFAVFLSHKRQAELISEAYNGLHNNAEALAEALRDTIASLDWAKAIIRDIPEESSFNQGLNEAKAALANWEGVK